MFHANLMTAAEHKELSDILADVADAALRRRRLMTRLRQRAYVQKRKQSQ